MKGYALTRPLLNTLSRIQAIFWHFRIVDGNIFTREKVLVSAPMGGDRVKHGYGGMVPAALRLGRRPLKRESPLEAASWLSSWSNIVPSLRQLFRQIPCGIVCGISLTLVKYKDITFSSNPKVPEEILRNGARVVEKAGL